MPPATSNIAGSTTINRYIFISLDISYYSATGASGAGASGAGTVACSPPSGEVGMAGGGGGSLLHSCLAPGQGPFMRGQPGLGPRRKPSLRSHGTIWASLKRGSPSVEFAGRIMTPLQSGEQSHFFMRGNAGAGRCAPHSAFGPHLGGNPSFCGHCIPRRHPSAFAHGGGGSFFALHPHLHSGAASGALDCSCCCANTRVVAQITLIIISFFISIVPFLSSISF